MISILHLIPCCMFMFMLAAYGRNTHRYIVKSRKFKLTLKKLNYYMDVTVTIAE